MSEISLQQGPQGHCVLEVLLMRPERCGQLPQAGVLPRGRVPQGVHVLHKHAGLSLSHQRTQESCVAPPLKFWQALWLPFSLSPFLKSRSTSRPIQGAVKLQESMCNVLKICKTGYNKVCSNEDHQSNEVSSCKQSSYIFTGKNSHPSSVTLKKMRGQS